MHRAPGGGVGSRAASKRPPRSFYTQTTGALTRSAVRHILRRAARLAVLLVLLGLGTVPVECTSVYGPHSIFITAQAVAQVRDGGNQHSHALHGAMSAHSNMSEMASPNERAAELATQPIDPSTLTSKDGVTTRLPTPAGASIDALIAVALFEPDTELGPSDVAMILSKVPLPISNPLAAPDPPPPQRNS